MSNNLDDLKAKLALAAVPHELTDTGKSIANVATMLAAQAKAAVEARYLMALHRPRNMDDVRQILIGECKRPSFAHNKSVWYRKPIGKGVEGLGIRFVEAALRSMTNVLVETTTLHDDEQTRILNVSVTDLECNDTQAMTITIVKTVERSRPLEDGSYISVRTNSQGQKTYTVPGNDDDILNKQGALVSKAVRTLGLRIIPGDLQDECKDLILRVRADEAAKDPNTERKRIADGFAELNVMPSELSEYLGHDFGGCSPAELVQLRGLWGAISEGEATWASALREAKQNRIDQEAARLKEKLKDQAPKPAAAGQRAPRTRVEPPSDMGLE